MKVCFLYMKMFTIELCVYVCACVHTCARLRTHIYDNGWMDDRSIDR